MDVTGMERDAGIAQLVAEIPALNLADYARSIVGRRYRVNEEYEVGREKIREYARAVRDEHPVHWNEFEAAAYGYRGLLAPPTFTCLLSGAVQKMLAAMLTGYDLSSAVQTDQVFNYHQPIVAGDRLTSNVSLHSFRQAFGGDLMVVENTITNQRDETVLTAYTSLIARSVQTEKDNEIAEFVLGLVRHDVRTPDVPAPTPEPIAHREFEPLPRRAAANGRALASVREGAELPPRTVRLTRGDLVNYAGVSGDPNPIHWSDRAAEMVGLEQGIVAHGMLTMGLGAGFVTAWLDDPGALLQYSVRMTSPVYVSFDGTSEIRYTGKIKSVDPATGTATIAIGATHADRKIFGRATAVVQLS
ncbi:MULTISPECIES: fused (3R)-hydroxyacyl-ACP dehydratase subunits HadA/HadB [unclassified Nocardia]|uniref:fused (3R)-hydroxyacyl-ACP dehydratase subunits HadA/HadB n=1 Tax=unclassified Nocardia TaxID=2637762 RepID=UPI001CE49AE6|nr:MULTISPECIES: fused (3R)-hydroxyacyl-ACP dehydratase subunits HadA/HadB [unclassified Nocardia]